MFVAKVVWRAARMIGIGRGTSTFPPRSSSTSHTFRLTFSHMGRYILVLLLLGALTSPGLSQQSVGSVAGHIQLANPDQAESLRIRAEEITTEVTLEETEVDSAGDFALRDLPFATYELYVVSEGHAALTRRVIVHSAVAMHISIDSVPNFEQAKTTLAGTGLEPTSTFDHPRQTEVHTLLTGPI